jgi:hypothetical protein
MTFAKLLGLLIMATAVPACAAGPNMVVRFEITQRHDSDVKVLGHFDFVRSERDIAMRDSRNGFWDIWQKSDDGRVSLNRVVPALSAFVEIESGELASRNLSVEWTSLRQPFAPSVVQACFKSPANAGIACDVDSNGQITAVRFSSGKSVEEWKAVDIPQTELAKVESSVSAPVGFHRWDAADFGDQENLPALREFQKAAKLDVLLGGHSEHAH